jgi:hypothetical protein
MTAAAAPGRAQRVIVVSLRHFPPKPAASPCEPPAGTASLDRAMAKMSRAPARSMAITMVRGRLPRATLRPGEPALDIPYQGEMMCAALFIFI